MSSSNVRTAQGTRMTNDARTAQSLELARQLSLLVLFTGQFRRACRLLGVPEGRARYALQREGFYDRVLANRNSRWSLQPGVADAAVTMLRLCLRP